MTPGVRRWLIFASIWAAATLLWTLVAASSPTETPLQALPFGAAQMGVAALLALGVWRLTAAVPWAPHSIRFYVVHGAAMAAFALLYACAPFTISVWMVGTRRAIESAMMIGAWNLLMGSWLYLAIAGVCYSRRNDEALGQAREAIVEARLHAREAQLAAVNARLQPHFLFNALHTVSTLVHVDPDRADQAIDQLGQLLRYALRSGHDEVPLAEEWAFSREYLAFESLRLGDRLRLDIGVDDAALDRQVPAFVLQPLIENAIHHGVADRPEGGRLRVRIRRDPDDAVRIAVWNDCPDGGVDGAGMSGRGLRDLADRLTLKYGSRAAVSAGRNDDGFLVSLVVPGDTPEVRR
jgi:signal transduction histidine kinase